MSRDARRGAQIAQQFGIPADVLAAVILNEMNSTGTHCILGICVSLETWKDNAAVTAGVECLPKLGCVSLGIGQIQLKAAREAEEAGYVPGSHSYYERVRRLRDPVWNIWYAGAHLAHRRDVYISQAGRLNVDYTNDLIILYFAHPNTYLTWAKNYADANPYGGDTTGKQLEKVRALLPIAVRDLTVRLSP